MALPDPSYDPLEPADERPEDMSASEAELVDAADTFEQKMNEDFRSARSAYQNRFSSIMDEFLNKGLEGEKREPPPASRRASPSRDDMEAMMTRMAREMRAYEAGARAGAAAAATPAALALPAPEAPRRTRLYIAAAGALALIAGATVFAQMRQVAAYTPLPYARTGAIAVAEGKIFIGDWLRKSLYVHEAKRGAPILAVESLPVNLLTGLAVDRDSLWTADGLASEIARRSKTSDHVTFETFRAPANTAGLALDGTSIWTTGKGRLYRLRADDPTDVAETFDMPDVTVTALQLRNRRVWVLDGKSREIAVFRLQKDLKPLATLDLDPFLRGGAPTGLAISGSDAWIVTENPSAIVRVPLRKLKKSREPKF